MGFNAKPWSSLLPGALHPGTSAVKP
jgi:hypothetical protein